MKKQIKKIHFILLIFLLIGVLFSLTSCQPGKEGKPKGPVTINMWIMPNSLEPVNDLKSVLAEFEKQNPNITVKVTSVDWGAAWTKLTIAATSRDVPDIVQIGSTWVGSISSFGALWDLSERMKELGGKNAFVPASWTSTGITGSGQVTAIPWIVDARAIYYRTDVFQKLGLTAADLSTWNSFVRTLQKIKNANLKIDGKEVVPLGISGKNDWNVVHNISPWIWAAGGDYFSKDLSTCTLNEKGAFDGIFFYVDFAKKEYVPQEYLELNTAQVSSKFNDGLCAIYFDGPYEVKNLTTPPEQGGALGSITSKNFGIAPYPKGPKGRYTFVGGSNLAIFEASKHKEEAWEVVKYLLTKDAQIAYAKFSGFLPAKLEAFNDPFIASDPQRKIFIEAINTAGHIHVFLHGESLKRSLQDALESSGIMLLELKGQLILLPFKISLMLQN